MEDTNEGEITVITDIVASIRLRPAMFIGRLGAKGIAEMIHGLIRCQISPNGKIPNYITLEIIDKDSVTVKIQMCEQPDFIIDVASNIQKAVASPLDWGHFAVSVVCTKDCQLTVNHNTVAHQFNYKNGVLVKKREVPLADNAGEELIMTFTVDSVILKGSPSFDYLEKEASIFALLDRNCRVLVKDTTQEHFQQRFYHYPNGMKACFDSLVAERSIGDTYFPIFIDEEISGRSYQLCLSYGNYWQYPQPSVYLFAEGKPTEEGGSLLSGIIKGLRKACKEYVVAGGYATAKTPHSLLYRGLILVANVAGGSDYTFEGASGGRLAMPDIERVIKAKVYETAKAHMAACDADAKTLINRFDGEIWAKNIIADLEERTKKIKESENEK